MNDLLTAPLACLRQRIEKANPCRRTGRLEAIVGSSLVARLPGARLGEGVRIGAERIPADVCAFSNTRAILLPVATCTSMFEGMPVLATGDTARVPWSPKLLGRVIDARGQALDGKPLPEPASSIALDFKVPAPLDRQPIAEPLETGVRAIDGLNTLGRGQRIGLFAGPGLGKSTLLGQIARQARADCIVLAMVGERGRELDDFLRRDLGDEGLRRSLVVCATSDSSAAERARALPLATALAHGFRQRGKSVLLLADSLTRHARACREIGLAAGEPPGRRGFPPSVFDGLARLIERAGNDRSGSMSAVYTVLTEGNAEDDPLAAETKSLLDGHIVLDVHLAEAGCFPAIDPCASLSRLMDKMVSGEHLGLARRARELWSVYEQRRELIAAGAYQPGSEPMTDRAIELHAALRAWISQPREERCGLSQAFASLAAVLGSGADG